MKDLPEQGAQRTREPPRSHTVSGLVSVIIPTLDSAIYLRRTLDSLGAQSYVGVETIVVDGGSSDSTVGIARSTNARIETGSFRRSSARRWGAAQARGEYLLFLDSDQGLDVDVIRDAVEASSESKAEAIVIPERDERDDVWSECRAVERKSAERFGFSYPRFIQARKYWSVGGHRHGLEDFMEDRDLYLRLVRSSCAIGHIASQIVNYHDSDNLLAVSVKGLRSAGDASVYFRENRSSGESLVAIVMGRSVALLRTFWSEEFRSARLSLRLAIYLSACYGPRFVKATFGYFESVFERSRSPLKSD